MENILAAILKLSREEKVQIYNALEDDLNGFEKNVAENHLSDEEWGLVDERLEEGTDPVASANHDEVMKWINEKQTE